MSLVEEKPTQALLLDSLPTEPVSLWRNSDYLRLWTGQVASAIGSQVSGLALPLLILALTHSPAKAGGLAALRGLPYFLLCLPAGALVDRWDPRRVMLACGPGARAGLGAARTGLRTFRLASALPRDRHRRDAVCVLQPGRVELPGAGRDQTAALGGGRAERGGLRDRWADRAVARRSLIRAGPRRAVFDGCRLVCAVGHRALVAQNRCPACGSLGQPRAASGPRDRRGAALAVRA